MVKFLFLGTKKELAALLDGQGDKKMNENNARQPFFYDVTLRDGNQALPKPWNNAQKKDVYLQLLKLGVQGAEVGFPASSEMDFESCKELAQLTAKMAEEGDEVAKRVVVPVWPAAWKAISSAAGRPCSLLRIRVSIPSSPQARSPWSMCCT
jgi:Isopropylmalate/homocitrate/citramalate synthases